MVFLREAHRIVDIGHIDAVDHYPHRAVVVTIGKMNDAVAAFGGQGDLYRLVPCHAPHLNGAAYEESPDRTNLPPKLDNWSSYEEEMVLGRFW